MFQRNSWASLQTFFSLESSQKKKSQICLFIYVQNSIGKEKAMVTKVVFSLTISVRDFFDPAFLAHRMV